MKVKLEKCDCRMQDPTLKASYNHKDGSASPEIAAEEG